MRELADGVELELAGVRFAVEHTPGHTQGSVVFRSPYAGPEDVPEVMFSGDLLFAGSIGRTDLPGGDHAQMLTSLAASVLPLDDRIVVLPGHGPQTTIGRERAPTRTWPTCPAPGPGPRRADPGPVTDGPSHPAVGVS